MTTQSPLIEARDTALAFAKSNLRDCAAELVQLSRTGQLPSGKVRELAALCSFAPGEQRLGIAQRMIEHAAVEAAAV